MPELINDAAFRSDAQTAVDSIYNFKFQAADKQLRPWQEQYPDHPLWDLMDGIKLWWQVLSDLEDPSNDEQFFNLMKRVDYKASQLLRRQRSHADALIIKAVSNGYIGRQYANRSEWISSVNQARKAMSAYEYLLELKPDLADLKLAEGMKLYYSAHLPEAYPIVKTVSWFLPEGDKEEGLKLMKVASEEAIFARAEATYFLGNINYNYEHNYETALRHFRSLYETYPNNNYYVRYYVRVLYRMKKYETALNVISESLQRWEQNSLAFESVLREELLTWKGRMLTKENKKDEALSSLRLAFEAGFDLPATQNRSYHVISGFLLGKLLHENNSRVESKKVLTHVAACKAEPEYREAAQKLMDNS
ncbi:MAG: hypothetical protein U5J95_11620 [Balneolaceae bacterium]|nr:hypothetical protein [Balneolaceae bacterium]